MSKFFDKLPNPKFFKILNGVNKEIYVEALFVLKRSFDSEVTIYRKQFVANIKNSLSRILDIADFAQDAEEEGEDISSVKEISQKANFVVRTLEQLKWIIKDYDSSVDDDIITVPYYSIELIDSLYKIAMQEKREYSGYVYSVYTVLSKASENRKDYAKALRMADSATYSLIREMKLLLSNIKLYCQQVSDEINIKAILKNRFDDYKKEIQDRLIYPLRTYESIKIFKTDITRLLDVWMDDNSILDQIAFESVEENFSDDIDSARREALKTINRLKIAYKDMNDLMRLISDRNDEYSKITLDRIDYKLNADTSIKGMILDILECMSNCKVEAAMAENITAFGVCLPDDSSIVIRQQRDDVDEIPASKVSRHRPSQNTLAQFSREILSQFTVKDIDAFLEKCFGAEDEFYTGDIRLSCIEDIELLVLGTIRAYDMKRHYKVEFLGGNINVDGYGIPKAIFRRVKCLKKK